MARLIFKRNENRQLTQHFNQREFDCHGGKGCCSCGCVKTELDSRLLHKLQALRLISGKPLIVSSGYRCDVHNSCVGGAGRSLHTRGMAADVSCRGIPPIRLAALAQSLGFAGIGRYTGSAGNFVHVDVRDKRYFWINLGGGNTTASGHGGVYKACPYALGSAALKTGSSGESVRALQWMLDRSGVRCEVDGSFGAKTLAAVKRFQKAMALEQDGIFGAKTRSALREAVE